ncbi:VWA domain-containing protein [Alcanivorax sp. S6407]|uniref:vWA domain-containing protein n=1 Tax=Alcanivorax sp. S6407 TaxID=2926424 RepID=UPI001FF329F8|nr:VWA domain-containing protein [Alcanivorax sp. S6407]MCK0155247.1 VWA domain-containing protein [Alcanivorax sp. S6407]
MLSRRLSEFVQALRGAGLRVSPDEAAIAMQAVALVGYDSRQRFHDALAVSLVKEEQHRAAFETTFERYFEGHPQGQQEQEGDAAGAEAGSSGMPPALDSADGDGLEGSPGEQEGAELNALLSSSAEQLQQRMAEAAAGMDFTRMEVMTQQGLYTRRLLMNMGMGAVDDRVLQLAQGSAADEARADSLREWRSQVREQAASLVRRQFLLHGAAKGRELREQTMRQVAFRDLREFNEVKTLVRRMARRLASAHQRRLKVAKRGQLDARRTLGRSIRHDGVPVSLVWRRKPPHKSRVMVICDVSSSVSDAARFLLQFLYALNDVLPRVRSFAFASQFDEISDDFQRYPPDVAVGRVLDRLSGSGTDYGAMLEDFLGRCERELDRHTTVIILGDARNNYLPERAELLGQIRRRAKQVWWLNPEARRQWNSGDAVMASYLPHCRVAHRCANLNDLERLVDSLLTSLRAD